MQIKDVFGEGITLTEERIGHIITRHPEMKEHIKEISVVVNSPDLIKRSVYDKEVFLYHKYYPNIYGGCFIVVSIVKRQREKFITTAYTSKYEKRGGLIWKKN
mgnify:CR=1 FL=1